jgi:hypothetical protein
MQHTAVLDHDPGGRSGSDHPTATDGKQAGKAPATSELLARANLGDQAAWEDRCS